MLKNNYEGSSCLWELNVIKFILGKLLQTFTVFNKYNFILRLKNDKYYTRTALLNATTLFSGVGLLTNQSYQLLNFFINLPILKRNKKNIYIILP